MDRAKWVAILERWFNPAQIENLPGWRFPSDVPIFAGARMKDAEEIERILPIRILIRDLEASDGEYVRGYVQGDLILADHEAYVLVQERKCCSFVPLDTIVCIVV